MLIRNIEPDELNECISILENIFDGNEIRTAEEIKELYQKGKMNVICAFDHDQIISCMLYWQLEHYLFLENFGTIKQYRNKGIGKKILNALKKFEKPMILECELPQDDNSKRRIAYYQSNGFSIVKLEYYLPPLRSGNKPIPMYLMAYGMMVSLETIEDIYTQVYANVISIKDYESLGK